MNINFLVNEVAGEWEPTDTRLGGTEESVAQWAKELVELGHNINVYRNGEQMNTHNGVHYWDRKLWYSKEHNEDVDMTINVKSSNDYPRGNTLYLTNETNATELDLGEFLGVIWPSQWCVDNIPVNNKTFILPHGYDETKIFPGKKVPKQCFYASSPDRGLDILLDAWPEVYEAHPDATLIVTYGADVDLPGVMNMGELDDDTMNELYQTSDIWCHPCSGGELYCMTGKKAQVAGCIPIIIPTMALAETVERGFKTDKEHYAETLIGVLNMKMEHRDAIRKDVIEHANAFNWKESTDKLLDIIKSATLQ